MLVEYTTKNSKPTNCQQFFKKCSRFERDWNMKLGDTKIVEIKSETIEWNLVFILQGLELD